MESSRHLTNPARSPLGDRSTRPSRIGRTDHDEGRRRDKLPTMPVEPRQDLAGEPSVGRPDDLLQILRGRDDLIEPRIARQRSCVHVPALCRWRQRSAGLTPAMTLLRAMGRQCAGKLSFFRCRALRDQLASTSALGGITIGLIPRAVFATRPSPGREQNSSPLVRFGQRSGRSRASINFDRYRLAFRPGADHEGFVGVFGDLPPEILVVAELDLRIRESS